MFSCEVVRSAKPSSPSIRVWKTCPAGNEYASAPYERTVFAETFLPPPCPTSTFEVITLITCGSRVTENADSTWSLNARTNCCWRAFR